VIGRILLSLSFCSALAAAELKPATTAAFEKYLDKITPTATAPKLWVDGSPDRAQRVRAGEVLVAPMVGKGDMEITGGLVHDWIGAAFIPGTTLAKTLALVQDYDDHERYYKPEVPDAKLIARQDSEFRIFYRFVKKKVITVVLNTYHTARYSKVNDTQWQSRSFTTRVHEVENAGRPDEHEKPAGTGHGFVWRLDTFWNLLERDGGVYVECRAITLTRGVPMGLGWLIEPIVRDLPKESLVHTLRSTREALK
jgi:hypothetical protein